MSHPMRVRGLKYLVVFDPPHLIRVAPHAGAWIEMGLERPNPSGQRVAPHAGAWIEMCLATTFSAVMLVAPHAGAWIEMANNGS